MSEKLRVKEAIGLLVFLDAQLKNWSKSNIKQRLKTGCVSVNGKQVTQFDCPLQIGDTVDVGATIRGPNSATDQLEILYEDSDLIAVNKPAGLLSVASEQEKKIHALTILRNQLSRRSLEIRLWPVHRLDRDTSGVLLFAKSKELREAVMADWNKALKSYLAIVADVPKPASGVINQPLRMDDDLYQMHVGAHPDAKPAVTHYSTERSVELPNGKRTLLLVQLDTGRQHQIRAHMAWLGHAVIGDSRYGTAGRRLGLHALSLTISHPRTQKRITFETRPPTDFLELLKG